MTSLYIHDKHSLPGWCSITCVIDRMCLSHIIKSLIEPISKILNYKTKDVKDLYVFNIHLQTLEEETICIMS